VPAHDPKVGETWRVRSFELSTQAVITRIKDDVLTLEGRQGTPAKMPLQSFLLVWEFEKDANWDWACHVEGCSHPAWFRLALSERLIVSVCAGHRPWEAECWLPVDSPPKRVEDDKLWKGSLHDMLWMPQTDETWWKMTGQVKRQGRPVIVAAVTDERGERLVHYRDQGDIQKMPLDGFWKHFAREEPVNPDIEVGSEYTNGHYLYIAKGYDLRLKCVALKCVDQNMTLEITFKEFQQKFRRLVRRSAWDRLMEDDD